MEFEHGQHTLTLKASWDYMDFHVLDLPERGLHVLLNSNYTCTCMLYQYY